ARSLLPVHGKRSRLCDWDDPASRLQEGQGLRRVDAAAGASPPQRRGAPRVTTMPSRESVSLAFAATVGSVAVWRWPFPEDQVLLQLVHLERPALFDVVKGAYLVMLFTTPFIAAVVLWSLGYIFLARPDHVVIVPRLPPYSRPETREKLFVVLGEVH